MLERSNGCHEPRNQNLYILVSQIPRTCDQAKIFKKEHETWFLKAVGVAILPLAWFSQWIQSEIQDESAQKVDHNKTLDLNDTSWKEVGSKTWIVPSAGIEMIWCEPGTFMMGSPKSEFGRR